MKNGARRRVVVTGLGMVSPLGLTVESTWAGIVAGKSGIGQITRFDTTGLETTIAGELKDFDPTLFMDRKEIRRSDRFAQMAVASAGQALRDAKLDITAENAPSIGVAFGSGIGGVGTLVDNVLAHAKDPRKVSPFMIPMMIVDMAAGEIAMKYGAKGPNMGHVSACASSAHSIGEATDTIRRGQADMMLAGGSEAGLIKIAIAAFNQARALSTRNDAPERASRPFDKDRDGFVFSEAAGCLVLEELEHARERGATIMAEVIGYGASADAHHVTAPAEGGEGALRAMRMAIEDAAIAPTDVAYVNAHGTSTQANDVSETTAIKNVFGSHASTLAVSSTKSMTGHTLGAAGAIEAIFCVLGMRDDVMPPTINLDDPDPECDLDYVPNVARKKAYDISMSNSMGFGGHNASLLISKG
ncbi:MAG TPA: beta-ketoacyl-ACP synthase II, partial [Candidatus Limnocylindrales bacterium]|nr:beta-ketoacyl-ACP synthase II [Candidatus Limnocylindrales bacterium]